MPCRSAGRLGAEVIAGGAEAPAVGRGEGKGKGYFVQPTILSITPFGGYKQSANGRKKNGIFGFEEFLEFKAMQLKPAAS